MERFVAAMVTHCRPARPDNVSMRCDMDAAPRSRANPTDLDCIVSRRAAQDARARPYLRLLRAKTINCTQELITGPCELSRAPAGAAAHCRLARCVHGDTPGRAPTLTACESTPWPARTTAKPNLAREDDPLDGARARLDSEPAVGPHSCRSTPSSRPTSCDAWRTSPTARKPPKK